MILHSKKSSHNISDGVITPVARGHLERTLDYDQSFGVSLDRLSRQLR